MTAPRPTNTGHADRRAEHNLGALAWGILLVLSVLFTIATAGIGVFAVGIVLAVGVVMFLVGHGDKS